MATEETDIAEAVYRYVRSIPPGKVVTYGQVADGVTGVALTARQVGAIMTYVPKDVPWQRVVGAGGRLPIAKRGPELEQRQRRLLEQEGVVFKAGESGCVDMARSQWIGSVADDSQASLFDEAG